MSPEPGSGADIPTRVRPRGWLASGAGSRFNPSMRLTSGPLWMLVALALAAPGCQTKDDPDGPPAPGPRSTKGGRLAAPAPTPPSTNSPGIAAIPTVLPASGRIHSLNPGLRFVVIDYTLGGLPPLQSLLTVYRNGEKVGQVRLSGPERNGFAAADIVEGILQLGDEVRIQ